MTNTERDAMMLETHDNVISLVTINEEREKRCAAHEKQIATLFDGYNQTQKNTTSIKVIAVIGTILWGTLTSAGGWCVKTLMSRG